MCNELFELRDKVAVITGGGGVLCGAIAAALSEMGVKVAILDVNEKAARDAAQRIEKEHGEAIGLKADVLSRDSLEDGLKSVLSRFKRIDFLINGAGGNKKEATTTDELKFFDLPPDAIRWVFDLNFLGTFLPCQVFGREMVRQKTGVILNISSMNAFRPLTRIPAYSAAKAAVSNFTQWLSVHMAQNYSKQIRVNAIAPGFFLTEQNRFLLMDEKTKKLTARGETIIAHTPMGRFGEAEDLIGTVIWLLSDASIFVHGIVVPVDGGFSAYSGV